MSFSVLSVDQNLKCSVVRFFATNASIEQFVACSLEEIGFQMEFQRLVKEQCVGGDDSSTEVLCSAPGSSRSQV